MRIALATRHLRLAADLAANYAGVELAGVFASYTELVEAVKAAPAREPIDAVVVGAHLDSARDRDASMAVGRCLRELRAANHTMRLVVSTTSIETVDAAEEVNADFFVAPDPDRSAAQLAAILGLVIKTDAARVMVVAGLQGGAGRTYAAAQLADTYAERTRKREGRGGVLLWELDLKHPTLAFDHEFNPTAIDHGRRTIARLLNSEPAAPGEEIPQLLGAVAAADATGLSYDVLLAPHGIMEVISLFQSYEGLIELRDRIRDILELARRHYQVVIIDLGTDFINDPAASVALNYADAVISVATPSPAGESSVIAMRQILGQAQLVERSRLVLNRVRREDARYVAYCREAAGSELSILAEVAETPGSIDGRTWIQIADKLAELGR